MSYIEELRKSRNKPQVAYQEFALSTRKYPNHLFCFFEGKDNDYYVPRIKQFTDKYHPIKCDGRDKVLAVYQLIRQQPVYSKYKKGFFIDRDFHPPLVQQSPPIFETPCYSIENLYVSEEVFEEFLTNDFHLSKASDAAFATCLSLFRNRQKEYHEATLLFNAWYACLIDIRNKTGSPTGVNLGDKFPKGFLSVSLDSITANYDLETIKNAYPNATEVSAEALDNKIAHFSACDCSKTFRGKYELQFVIIMVDQILRDSANPKQYIKDRIKFDFGNPLSIGQALKVFSAYAITPKSLNSYLKEVIKP